MAVDSLLIKAPTAAGEGLAEANQEDRAAAASRELARPPSGALDRETAIQKRAG